MDSELMLDVGQANEFKLALRRCGWTNADLKRLSEGTMLSQILPVVRGLAEVSVVKHVIDCDAAPLLPYADWKVEEHKPRGQLEWDLAKLRLHFSDNQQGGKSVVGNKLRKELDGLPTLNANVLDYLLEHPHLIPESWKVNDKGETLFTFFWATIYRIADGYLCVRSLYFHEGHWQASYYWLGSDFGEQDPAVVSQD